MSSTPTPSMSSRLGALTQRLGLSGRSARLLLERAAALQLPFGPVTLPPANIWWLSGPRLQLLPELPRSALSGPVQDDKSAAHAALVELIEQDTEQLEAFDLRLIDGLAGGKDNPPACASFEDYLAGLEQRQVRIISYKDFVKAISQALPRFALREPIHLLQASWHGNRVFWNGEQQVEAFANAIAYARRRGLEVTLPAALTRYRISPSGLARLEANYHVLAMPLQSWSHAPFMSLLVDSGIPYARLSLMSAADAAEFLLLPKSSAEASALGEGLLLAGAPDICVFLRQL
ncbi:DUF6685 family protein [Pseudomonas sp. N040]|uniref:DUF6685 family protein n=1 Tax=Pseudomonas sp. N040 TaxID=2785325 RepID=UPI0018A26B83|nr:DUF6685 family protein [Pseudomonas sp. N040]MBF7731282.1 hypothetical protein [Pseudomonas sp. N040]MBW7014925.1 hypothetical protein [Pseudomonas sp. N040]